MDMIELERWKFSEVDPRKLEYAVHEETLQVLADHWSEMQTEKGQAEAPGETQQTGGMALG